MHIIFECNPVYVYYTSIAKNIIFKCSPLYVYYTGITKNIF